MEKLTTPIAFRPSVFAAKCSIVLTLIWYFGLWIVAVTVWVPSFSQYGRPGSNSSSDIQTMAASN